MVCYRVAQESLTNIARHARAQKVWLDLHAAGEQLSLRVADDGIGGVVTDGAGIKGMRERALLVDADSNHHLASGGGTEVRLTVPLRTQRSA